jgi:hypothetical protein
MFPQTDLPVWEKVSLIFGLSSHLPEKNAFTSDPNLHAFPLELLKNISL